MKRSAYDVIYKPLVTEATISGAQNRKYSFKVNVNANKIEIKMALKELF